MRLPVFVTEQAGKVVLTGTLSAQEIISALLSGSMAVNPAAQRSLARGAGKASTRELLDEDRAHQTARMAELVRFYLRVMESVEHGDQGQGFFGAIQLVLPARFSGARLRFVESEGGALPAGLTVALGALGRARRIATLEADPPMGEAVFNIGDGQGRCFGFYSFQRAVAAAILDHRNRLRRLEDAGQDAAKGRAELARLEAVRERIRRFLSDTSISFVCYASALCDDGLLLGLGEEAEKRLYIEGNALNSQATKEEVVKYESFSPVVLALQEDRMAADNLWMDSEYIEEDSKIVAEGSPKVFTLSALLSAYSVSMIGHPDPISNPDAAMFRRVSERVEFVRAFWKRVSRVLGPLWVPVAQAGTPPAPLRGAERLAYVKARRAEMNVAFQAVFLLALGRAGYTLGRLAGWDPGSPLLDALDRLEKGDFRGYHAEPDGDPADPTRYRSPWVRALMRPRPGRGKKPGGYAFHHARETIAATHEVLLQMLEIDAERAAEAAETESPAHPGAGEKAEEPGDL